LDKRRRPAAAVDQGGRQTGIAIDFAGRIESSVTDAEKTNRRASVSELIEWGSLKKVIAMYPGSFDPPTNGHLDLIARGSKIFDELVVAILRNAEKAPLFNLSERLLMLEEMTAGFKNVRVDTFDGLMVDYAAKVDASAVLRGIRAISDYEYELQMALMNRKLQPDLETVFMMPAEQYSYLSSRLVREIAQLGGSVKDLVPEMVEQRLKEKLDPAIKLANARNPKSRKRV
jgi:pantetheine-phosphate adenylyltransferase